MIIIPAKICCDHIGCDTSVDIFFEFTKSESHNIPEFELQRLPDEWDVRINHYREVEHFCPKHK